MLKVMIVDNESAIRKGLVHCIHWGDLGCEIAAQADDGMMALEQIPVIQPNIVISDIRMPGMDGLELAEIIARDHPGIKVIILTGYPDFAYAQRAISSIMWWILSQADNGERVLSSHWPWRQTTRQSGPAGETLHDLGAQHGAAAEHAAA